MTEPSSSDRRTSRKMRIAELYAGEVILMISSIWAAKSLFLPPPTFDKFPPSFILGETLQGREQSWAIIATIAATLAGLGLGLLAVHPRLAWLSYTMRFAGLIVSGLFWAVTGLAVLCGNPDSLFGIWGLIAAATAWWTLLRLPVVPGEH